MNNQLNRLLIIVSLFWSCSGPNNETSYPEIIHFDPTNVSTIRRSQLFTLDRVIWIENHEKIKLGSIDDGLDLQEAGDDYLIMGINNIALFDKRGRFLQTIGQKGKGPGEYTTKRKIVSNNHKFNLLDRSAQKIISYNPAGNFLNEQFLGSYPNTMACLQGYSVVYMDESNDLNKKLFLLDPEMKMVDRALDLNPETTHYMCAFSLTNFFHYHDSLRFLNPYDYTIHDVGIKNNKLVILPRYQIDFGKYNIPQNFHEQKFKNVVEYDQKLILEGYANSLWWYWENNHIILLDYRHHGKLLTGIYDKRSRRTLSAEKMIDDIVFKGIEFSLFHEVIHYFPLWGQIHFVVEAYRFKELMQQTKSMMTPEEWDLYKKEMPDIISIYEKIDDNDNPVIFVFDVNDFNI